ncbi:MAG: NAD-dependent epimerase/dehydratase family protein [Rhabdochlamydiaceae bacterium]|nr:NAD-dependent epimerase/dehydratase family protein [Candidatus Amphrikana amoebophyrae]
MSTQNQTIYVTGIAGFIGFHLACRLHSMGYSVVGCDTFNDAYPPKIKHDRAKILRHKRIEIYQASISNRLEQDKIFQKHKPDIVINLAAQAGVRASLAKPEVFVESNLVGFVELCELMRKYPPKKFIYASSSSVYGDNTKFPLAESDKADHPVSLYGATKKANEVIAYSYHSMFKVPTIGLRFFTCYGPYGRPDMAIYIFVKNILEGKPITVFNEGKMERDFTYVDDIVSGIVASISYETNFEIFNLGKGQTDDLNTLIDIIETRLKKKAIIDYQPRPAVDMPMNIADIEKSSEKLGFTPKTPLKEGVNKFIDWYLEYSK